MACLIFSQPSLKTAFYKKEIVELKIQSLGRVNIWHMTTVLGCPIILKQTRFSK